ncbi:DNA repair exonuclease SbcCD ATPase subunit [Mycolicibacterium neoaurum]|uniref:AAA family ATPase n=1 Tax=Mycolicibacterium neoaurum TaxID=1795 RepID=UPI0005637AC3|nr:ATP-binding protein [Mycolicibacterium neoaurum]SDE54790.1 DNA repair exonuclease SbcCD ATPase subunit [Mycolicibacterium neoaurum]
MKLHRLTLTNYRGVLHRDIEFPERGVVVVSGANEIGKSSMIEALDLLLTVKDRSSKKEVKAVKPTHADVGAEVSAEISTGPYRFIYRKRFHKKAETVLTELAPTRRQLTGDEAHDRVLAILDETVDTALWQAQRVLQASATAPVDLSGCDALSRALDVAAGAADGAAQVADVLGGPAGDADPLLIDKIEREYLEYFTATGRPTGVWAAATSRLRAADDAVAQCTAALREVEQAVTRHAVLTAELSGLAERVSAAEARRAAAQQSAEAVRTLAAARDTAKLLAEAAGAAHTAAAAAVTERRRMRIDIDERSTAAAELVATAAESAQAHRLACEVVEAAEADAERADVLAATAAQAVDTARADLAACVARDEAARLAARIAKLDTVTAELAGIERELASNPMTDTLVKEIDAAARAVERATGRAELASAHVELVALGDITVRVGDTAVDLATDGDWVTAIAEPTVIEVPGVLRARVSPGADALQTHAELEAAHRVLAELLEKAGVAEVPAAHALDERRRELGAARSAAQATVAALTDHETAAQLRARHAELTAGRPPAGSEAADHMGDTDTARAALADAVAAHTAAAEQATLRRNVVAAATAKCNDAAVTAGMLRQKLEGVQGELDAATQRLTVARMAATDEQLSLQAEADAERANRATAELARLEGELAAAQPDVVAAELRSATAALEVLLGERETATAALAEISAALKVYGSQGRRGALDAAEAEREHAHGEFLRVGRRARAAALLRTVMLRHRESARLRYVEPFRTEIERLGRLVFGPDFEVDIDTDLTIRSRTLAGTTVGYESLSGGAKEQMGIVARLACASLVAKEDTVPVVIDDALGFTDPERLTKMAAVFDAVGGDGQVIVLTCSPDRYAAIDDAQLIELTA